MTIPQFALTALWPSRGDADASARRIGPSDALITSVLAEMRDAGRRSIRILDLGCGDGERLLRAAACARALGYVAIEGRGTDVSAGCVRKARRKAEAEAHPSTELIFEIAYAIEALAAEHDGAADLILLSEPKPYPSSPLAIALDRVGTGPTLCA